MVLTRTEGSLTMEIPRGAEMVEEARARALFPGNGQRLGGLQQTQTMTQTMTAASPDDPPPRGSKTVTHQEILEKKEGVLEEDHDDYVGAGCCGGCKRGKSGNRRWEKQSGKVKWSSKFWNGLRKVFCGDTGTVVS